MAFTIIPARMLVSFFLLYVMCNGIEIEAAHEHVGSNFAQAGKNGKYGYSQQINSSLQPDPVAKDIPPNKVVLCHDPSPFNVNQCVQNENFKSDPKLFTLHISKIPHMDQWIHIDVIPTESALSSGDALKIRYAMIQLSDSQDRIIGRIAEQIPCTQTNHPEYFQGNGIIAELYQNPGPKGITVVECAMSDNLSYNSPPTVGIFTFSESPVQAFYVNIKFTREEAEYIFSSETKSNEFSITTVLVTESYSCYVQRTDRIRVGKSRLQQRNLRPSTVPWNCHQDLPKFPTRHHSTVWENIEFGKSLGFRPRTNIPRVSNPTWMEDIIEYNLNSYKLDAEGLTLAEREMEAASNERKNVTGIDQLDLPLIYVSADEWDTGSVSRTREFDPDDEECDDDLRQFKPKNVKLEIAQVYLKCAYSRNCIAEPEGCLNDTSCNFIVSWGKENDYVVFGVIADRVTYVAVGVSHDNKMGDDSVTECNLESNLVVGYTSWNYKNGEKLGNMRLRSCQCMQDFRGELVNDTVIFCSWKRPITTNIKGQIFNLNEPKHILSARGYMVYRGIYGSIEKHERTTATENGDTLNRYLGKSPFQFSIARFHGFFLLVMWTVVIPFATFVSRYLKGTFVTNRIYGFSVWYGLHFFFVTIGSIISLTAAVFPFVFNNYEKSKKESRQSWHSIVGIFMCLLIVAQMVLACVRFEYHLESQSGQQYLKFFHGVIGHMLEIFGYVCIFLSRDIKDGMPCNILFSFVLYISVCVILHLLMSYQICYADFIRGRRTSRVYKIFIVESDKDHDQPRRPRYRNTTTLIAEAKRRRRLTLDDVNVDDVEHGTIINPKLAQSNVSTEEWMDQLEKEEEPGSIMRRVFVALFVLFSCCFCLYYSILLLYPNDYPDCPSQKILLTFDKPDSKRGYRGPLN